MQQGKPLPTSKPMPGMMTPRLMDEEERQELIKRTMFQNKVSAFVQRIQPILFEMEFTWDEWGGVIDKMNALTAEVFPKITIKEAIERYDRLTTSEDSPRATADGGAESGVGKGERSTDQPSPRASGESTG